MPTYEYACRSCGNHLEVVQAFTEDPLTECPACQGSLRKVFSPVGIAFKGSGFYKTDSRSSGRSASSSSGEAKSSTATKETTGSSGEGAASTTTSTSSSGDGAGSSSSTTSSSGTSSSTAA